MYMIRLLTAPTKPAHSFHIIDCDNWVSVIVPTIDIMFGSVRVAYLLSVVFLVACAVNSVSSNDLNLKRGADWPMLGRRCAFDKYVGVCSNMCDVLDGTLKARYGVCEDGRVCCAPIILSSGTPALGSIAYNITEKDLLCKSVKDCTTVFKVDAMCGGYCGCHWLCSSGLAINVTMKAYYSALMKSYECPHCRQTCDGKCSRTPTEYVSCEQGRCVMTTTKPPLDGDFEPYQA